MVTSLNLWEYDVHPFFAKNILRTRFLLIFVIDLGHFGLTPSLPFWTSFGVTGKDLSIGLFYAGRLCTWIAATLD